MKGYSERGRNGPARCGNHYDSAQWNGPSGFDGRAIYIITHVTFFAGGSSRRPGARPHETPTGRFETPNLPAFGLRRSRDTTFATFAERRERDSRPETHAAVAPHSPRPPWRIPLSLKGAHGTDGTETQVQSPSESRATGKEESDTEGQSMQRGSLIRFKPSQLKRAIRHRRCRILRGQIREHLLSLVNDIGGSSTPPEPRRPN